MGAAGRALTLAELTRPGPDGVRYQRPEVGLLFASRHGRDKDAGDLAEVWPRLDDAARDWFRDALEMMDPEHPWLTQVGSR